MNIHLFSIYCKTLFSASARSESSDSLGLNSHESASSDHTPHPTTPQSATSPDYIKPNTEAWVKSQQNLKPKSRDAQLQFPEIEETVKENSIRLMEECVKYDDNLNIKGSNPGTVCRIAFHY